MSSLTTSLSVFLLHVSPTFAWGHAGHAITATIAESLIEPSTAEWVSSVLSTGSNSSNATESLPSVSNWADSITKSEPWSMPLHFINEEKCVGVKIGGGSIRKTLNEIEVSCLPSALPEYIEVDMLEVEVGTTVHLSDITLPEGVSSVALSHGEDSDLSVAQVVAPRGSDDADDAGPEAAGDAAGGDEAGDGGDS